MIMNKKMLFNYKSFEISLKEFFIQKIIRKTIYINVCDCNLKDLFIKSINLLFKKK